MTVREAPWAAGLRGARANLLPGLALQAVALALVVAYYQNETARHAVDALGALHSRVGLAFSAVSTALFGGLLPVAYLKLHPATRSRYTWRNGAFLIAFWGYKGVEVDLWYRLLAFIVGADHDTTTVLAKAVLDQLVYCPVLAVPFTVIAYEWCESGFDFRATLRDLRTAGWYGRRAMPLLVSNLGVWIPAVCIIYSLPTPLQLPLQNVVLCFFTLLVAHISRREPVDAKSQRSSGSNVTIDD